MLELGSLSAITRFMLSNTAGGIRRCTRRGATRHGHPLLVEVGLTLHMDTPGDNATSILGDRTGESSGKFKVLGKLGEAEWSWSMAPTTANWTDERRPDCVDGQVAERMLRDQSSRRRADE